MEMVKIELEKIIIRSRRDEESFSIDTKKAVNDVIEHLKGLDLIKQPEKKENY